MIDQKEIGVKHDEEKLKWSLLPINLLNGVVRVLMYGEKKYSSDNWKRIGNGKERYFSALMRHLTELQDGKELDDDSGLPVIDHVISNAIFMKYFIEKEKKK